MLMSFWKLALRVGKRLREEMVGSAAPFTPAPAWQPPAGPGLEGRRLPRWRLTFPKDMPGPTRQVTVAARTKSEARGQAKKRLGLGRHRLPVGTRIERLTPRNTALARSR